MYVNSLNSFCEAIEKTSRMQNQTEKNVGEMLKPTKQQSAVCTTVGHPNATSLTMFCIQYVIHT